MISKTKARYVTLTSIILFFVAGLLALCLVCCGSVGEGNDENTSTHVMSDDKGETKGNTAGV